MGWFIDKLDMHQEYPEGGLPVVGKHGIVRHDISTGELISDTVNSLTHEASYKSSLQIRCNGSSVTVTGNPSRYNRSENLWGFTTFEQCVQVYNQILKEYGLPGFTPCTDIKFLQSACGTKAKIVTNGAIIRHVDWTRNHIVGEGKEYSFIRGASTLNIGRGLEPRLWSNGATVDWLSNKTRLKGENKGSSFRYDKLYVKSKDLINHQKERLKGADEEAIKYYKRLIEYCQDCGVVREEQSKKRLFLKKYDTLAFYGLSDEKEFLPFLEDIEVAMRQLEVIHMRYEMIAKQLIDKSICKNSQSANATQAFAHMWLNGTQIDKSKSQYYVHRSRLLELGIDIANPYDVSRLPPQVRSLDVIELKPAVIPDWYQMPTIFQLKAA